MVKWFKFRNFLLKVLFSIFEGAGRWERNFHFRTRVVGFRLPSITLFARSLGGEALVSGRGAVRVAHQHGGLGVGGSNPPAPTLKPKGRKSKVEDRKLKIEPKPRY